MKGKIFKKVIASVSALSMIASMSFAIPVHAETKTDQVVDLSKFNNKGSYNDGVETLSFDSGSLTWSKLDLTKYTQAANKKTKKLTISYKETIPSGDSIRLGVGFYDEDVATYPTNKLYEVTDGCAVVYGMLGKNSKRVYFNDNNGTKSATFNTDKEEDVQLVIDFDAMTISGSIGPHAISSTAITTGIDSIDTLAVYAWTAGTTYKISDMKITAEISEENYYTVKYVDTLNKSTTRESVQENGNPANVPEDPEDSTGKYTFVGWSTGSDWKYDESQSSSYLSKENIEATSVTADITYTAVYKENTSYIEALGSIVLHVPAGNTLTAGENADTYASNLISVDITGESGGNILQNPDPSMNLEVTYELNGFKWIASENRPDDGDGTYCDSYGKLVVDDTAHTADFQLKLNYFNFYGSVKVTVSYGIGTDRKTLTAEQPLVYLGDKTVPNQILPRGGYISDFNKYAPDMVGYVATNSGDNKTATDVVTDNWGSYGSAVKTVSIAGDSSSRFLRLNTTGKKSDNGNGSSFASNMISNTADGQYITSQKVRFPSSGEIMLKSTYPTNWPADATAFSLGYNIKDHTGKVSLNGVDFSDTSTIESETWYTVVTTYDLTSKKCYAEIYNEAGTGDPLAKSEIVATSGATSTSQYMFRISDGVAGNFDFNDVAIKKAAIADDLKITSPKQSVIIPEDDSDEDDYKATLTLDAKTTEGLPALSAATWSLSDETGITVEESDDGQSVTLKVGSNANPGPLVVTATIGGKTADYTIQLTGSADNVQFVRDNGNSPASISIPLTSGQVDKYQYVARVADGNGETITDLSVESYELYNSTNSEKYTAQTMPTGITFNESTGEMTVSSEAKAVVVYVRANAHNRETPNPAPISNSMRVDIHGLAFDFGAGTAEDLVEGYTAITPSTTYRDGVSDYGISDGTPTVETESDTANILTDPGVDSLAGTYTFKVKVEPNRLYSVKAKFKGQLASEYINSDMTGVALQHTDFTEETYTIPVFDDVLDLTLSGYTYKVGDVNYTVDGQKLAYVEISPIDIKTPREGKPHVFSVGDSTIANGGSWAHGLDNAGLLNSGNEPYASLAKLVVFHNNGQGSQNLHSYYNNGAFRNRILNEVRPGDYVMIGDMGTNGMGSYFEDNLNFYIDACNALGAKVILNSYSPHGAKGNYTNVYDTTNQTFEGYRQDGYDEIIRRVWAENTNPNVIGFVDIGKMADAAFNAYVDDWDKHNVNPAYQSRDDAAQAIIACFPVDHNHYNGLARDLMLAGYGDGENAKGIVKTLIEIISADLGNKDPDPITHTVTFNIVGGATVSVDGTPITGKTVDVEEGKDLSFTVEPATGYKLLSVKVGDADVTENNGTYTLSDVSSDTTVTITTEVDTQNPVYYKYEAKYDTNGVLTELNISTTTDPKPEDLKNEATEKVFIWDVTMKPWSAD